MTMDSVLKETRRFAPPAPIAATAHIRSPQHYKDLFERSIRDPEGFWSEQAKALHWFSPWQRTLDWNPPDARWFVGGTTNVCYNCVDRHVIAGRGNDPAIVWEAEPIDGQGPTVRRLSFHDLHREVQRFANVLKQLGVRRGDRVTIYLPMIPELAIAMLACARIGAPHSIIFAGFSASAIRDRIEDAQSRILITADGAWRRGKLLPLKTICDEALENTRLVDNVVVVEHARNGAALQSGRDHIWSSLVDAAPAECPCEPMGSEDLLFLLYTSGTTGKPKGIMHTTGGYLVFAALTAKMVFDLQPGDLHWCTADIGWVTGHSYVVYGILANGITSLMYEGAPNHPAPDRFWDIIERHRVTKFYTAPTAIRAFMKWGDEHVRKHDLSSLKILGTVGEPINPEAWMWYHSLIGNERCPIVDTWWQTETGGHLITPLPWATTTTPGSATLPFFGIDAAVVDEKGGEVGANTGGYLVIRKPWPAMLRGIYGDRQRYIDTYWSRIPGCYFTGDGARRDSDGNFWIMGRIDDVINVAGHRLGTAEIESALVSHPTVAEAAVVGVPHELKGTGIAAFVTLRASSVPSDKLRAELIAHVGKEIGALAKPDQLRFADALPKTRSGKIMRRLLRELAEKGEVRGDTTTLEDIGVLAKLRDDEG